MKQITLIKNHLVKMLCLAAGILFLTGAQVNAQGPCVAYFTFTPDTTFMTGVQFTNLSTGSYTYVNWSFGDGTSSSQSNPYHVYNGTGFYLVCLTIGDSASGCQSTYCDTVIIGSAGCSAWFSQVTTSGNTVSFSSTITGNYSSLYWTFGDGGNSNVPNPVHTYANPGTYTVCLNVYDSASLLCTQTCSVINITVPPTDTLCGYVFHDANGNGLLDSGEAPVVGGMVTIYGNGIQYTVQTDANGFYSILVAPGSYWVYYCSSNFSAVFTVPMSADSGGCAWYSATITSGGNNCGWNFGFQDTAATIKGTVFADANNNGILDGGEWGIPWQTINVGGYSTYTDYNGNYSINVPLGTFNVTYTPSGSYALYPLTTPGSISVNAAVAGNIYSGKNFGLNIPPGTTNLSVMIVPHTTVTPGMPAWYDLIVCNNGVNPTAATLTMIYDPALTFSYSTPAQSGINTSTNTITWNLPVIAPGNCQYVWATFSASTGISAGDNTMEFASVFPTTGTDIDLSDNTDTVHQIVTSSWDPNNKLSIQTNNLDPNVQIISGLNPDQWITYSINFQNTGTSAAINIVVTDQLNADLDANTFQLLGTSHACNVIRNGALVNYNFSGIMLPDNTTNEPASHGSIVFRVKSLNGLPAGTVINDNASIYFDFNAPVITNDATVTMVNPTGINELSNSGMNVTVYPNPVADKAVVNFDLTNNADVHVIVTDAQGRMVANVTDSKLQAGHHSMIMNVKTLAKGNYNLIMQSGNETIARKFIVR